MLSVIIQSKRRTEVHHLLWRLYGASQYATVQKHRQNGGVAETSLTTNQPDDKDDVKYAEIKFPNNVSTKPNAPPPVESEYSTVKTSTKR